MNQIQRIEELITSLPKSDIKYGKLFLGHRDFESLQEIINSAIIKTKKNLNSDNPKAEYSEVDMEKLLSLKAEVDSYYSLIELSDNFYNDINDLDSDSFEEEFY